MGDALHADVAVNAGVVRNAQVDAFVGLTLWSTHTQIFVLLQEVLNDQHFGDPSNEVVIAMEQGILVCLRFEMSPRSQVLLTKFFSLFSFLSIALNALPFFNLLGHVHQCRSLKEFHSRVVVIL